MKLLQPTNLAHRFGCSTGTAVNGASDARMITNERDLIKSIEAIVGPENVTEAPSLLIGELNPRLVARPGTCEEIVACLKVCAEARAAVVPAGQMTWLGCGNPLRRADVVLSLSRLNRIIEYSPPDLTATVEAGLTLRDFNAPIRPERQWLPLDPPSFADSTLGAVASCNSSGALRLGFGTPRDYVIGLKLAHADGTESRSGGKVVKNVAGYDMNKLYVGSYGTLAVITVITFKLRPLPERSSTVLITAKYRGSLFQLGKRILSSELLPASVLLARGVSGLPEDALLIRFIDSEASVTSQVDSVLSLVDGTSSATVLNENEADAIWAEVADFDQHAIGVKLSVPLSAVPAEFEKAFLAHLECVATADIGTGIIRVAFDSDERLAVDQIKRLRANASAVAGSLFIEKAPPGITRAADAWGDAGPTAALMKSLKERFDPQSMLSPGRFVSGI
ncbi:MAG TPA: FAD-binding oxidoreductase [Blastocatellia bacterium]|nr:FAD-binding oxidoreductase [Blastocatellia bacterium]